MGYAEAKAGYGFGAFDPRCAVPGTCPYEESSVGIGGGKSYCGPWGCWTNCREVGHCVYAGTPAPTRG